MKQQYADKRGSRTASFENFISSLKQQLFG